MFEQYRQQFRSYCGRQPLALWRNRPMATVVSYDLLIVDVIMAKLAVKRSWAAGETAEKRPGACH